MSARLFFTSLPEEAPASPRPDERSSEDDDESNERGVANVESEVVPVGEVPCDVEEEAAPSAKANSPAKPRGPLEEMLEACRAPRLPINTDASSQAQGEDLLLDLGKSWGRPRDLHRWKDRKA